MRGASSGAGWRVSPTRRAAASFRAPELDAGEDRLRQRCCRIPRAARSFFRASPRYQDAGLLDPDRDRIDRHSRAVQTYVNRYVMLTRQASTFGMQELLDNVLVVVTLLALGGIATSLGPRLVFLLAPPLLVLLVIWLIRLSFRITANEPPEARAILRVIFNPSPWDRTGRQPTSEQG